MAERKHQNETGATLRAIYNRLLSHYGRQHWWPGDSPFEIIVGAILTQQTTWVNAHRAINRLKEAGALAAATLRRISLDALAELIYSSGYHHAKAAKLKAMAAFLAEACGDDLSRLFNTELPRLRTQLLAVHGIGEETADSILLYAALKPVFVIDAYTRRIVDRLGIKPERNSYAAYQSLFMRNLKADIKIFNEYHALLVRLGKEVCRPHPLCEKCCLSDLCAYHAGEKDKPM